MQRTTSHNTIVNNSNNNSNNNTSGFNSIGDVSTIAKSNGNGIGVSDGTCLSSASDSSSQQQQQQLMYANQFTEIQAQFELAVELRKFINIDLFQRGFYQIRLAVKCANKQIPAKISVQLENAAQGSSTRTAALSDTMYPSCVIDEYAVSKTFLILYRNEEIQLDDHMLFKISVLVNAFNVVESFERLGLQLLVELWFTENDYQMPTTTTTTTTTNSSPPSSQVPKSSSNNSISNSGANGGGGGGGTSGGGQQMQLLCSRCLKIKFDPRQGVHLQLPVIFDYFHLSAVLVTLHCTLLTLLPPVMLGTSVQRHLTLSSILFSKDLSQFKSVNEIGSQLMARALFIHNHLCRVLLASYEHLQDHMHKMASLLSESERRGMSFENVNCADKYKKISTIAQQCSDPETLDDFANRHIAQCSAENIMQWCIYLEKFSMNEAIVPRLAADYHHKRLKRFSEAFFTKDIARRSFMDYETCDNYVSLYELVRQSVYVQRIGELPVACDDVDGLVDNMPIIFEENYVQMSATSPLLLPPPPATLSVQSLANSSNSNSNSNNNSINIESLLFSRPSRDEPSTSSTSSSSFGASKKHKQQQQQQKPSKQQHRSTGGGDSTTTTSGVSSSGRYTSEVSTDSLSSSVATNEATSSSSQLSDSSRHLHRKLRKKVDDCDLIGECGGGDSGGGGAGGSASSSSGGAGGGGGACGSVPITLLGYRKTNDDGAESIVIGYSANASGGGGGSGSGNNSNSNLSSASQSSLVSSSTISHSEKLQQIKAELAGKLVSNSSNSNSNSNKSSATALHSIAESQQQQQQHAKATITAASATDLLFAAGSNDDDNDNDTNGNGGSSTHQKNHAARRLGQRLSKQQSLDCRRSQDADDDDNGHHKLHKQHKQQQQLHSSHMQASSSNPSCSSVDGAAAELPGGCEERGIDVDGLVLDINGIDLTIKSNNNNNNINNKNNDSNNDQSPVDIKSTWFEIAGVVDDDERVKENLKGIEATAAAAKLSAGSSEATAVKRLAAPSDCGFKSRILQESFRGRASTLERPKLSVAANATASSVMNHDMFTPPAAATAAAAATTTATTTTITQRGKWTRHETSFDAVPSSSSPSGSFRSNSTTTTVSAGVRHKPMRTDSQRSQRKPSTTAEEQAEPLAPPRRRSSLINNCASLAIQSNADALSANVHNDVLLKFTVAKEELKKLLAIKYHGNIYSEFASLFCTGPYFYAHLTPPRLASVEASAAAAAAHAASHHTPDYASSKKSSFKGRMSSLTSSLRSKNPLAKLVTARAAAAAIASASSANQSYCSDSSMSSTATTAQMMDDDAEGDDDVYLPADLCDERLHLVVCVHGLDGNSGDLRLMRTYLELALPGAKMDFLMSEHNQETTFDGIEVMTVKLIKEIKTYIDCFGIDPYRISFIGHSLGNLIIRSAVAHDDFKPLVGKLYTYLSLSGPHLGTLYNSSGLVNIGMWVIQKWKKSGSLLQMALKDHSDMTKTYLYKLSEKPSLQHFRHILLVASPQDRYVPFHSARIEMCKAAQRDSAYGTAYRDMVNNIMRPLLDNPHITFKRFSAFHTLPSGTSNFIGRAAHIAVLDSELFVEKLVLVAVAKYFR